MIVVALPVAWFLSRQPNAENIVWFCLPIAEAVSLFAAAALTAHIYRSRTKAMP